MSLIFHCVKLATDAGCDTIGLNVELPNDAALRLYEKLGFTCVYEYDSMMMSMNLKGPRVWTT